MEGMSYAVVWKERGQPEVPGRLDLADGCLILSGRASHGEARERHFPLTDVAGVHFERRLDSVTGRGRLLVVESTDGSRVELTSLEGQGALHELADEISAERA
jgi:hypothetical protein